MEGPILPTPHRPTGNQHSRVSGSPRKRPITATKSILDREVIVGDKQSSLNKAIQQSNPIYDSLPDSAKKLVVRSLENHFSQSSSEVFRFTNPTEFDQLVNQAVDYALQMETLNPNQREVINMIGSRLKPNEIADAVRIGALSPSACYIFLVNLHKEKDSEIKAASLDSFVSSLFDALAKNRSDLLNKQLKTEGFTIKPTKNDGNCFYNALLTAGIITPSEGKQESRDPQMQLRHALQTTAANLLTLYYTPNGEPTDFLNSVRQEIENLTPQNVATAFLWNDFMDFNNLKSLLASGDIIKDKEWASYAYAILVASATGHPIHLYGPEFTNNSGKFIPMIFDINSDGTRLETKPYSIMFNGKNHFEALVQHP